MIEADKSRGKPSEAEQSDDADARFNETLKRMLKTPPKPHEKQAKDTAAEPAKKVRSSKKR